MVAHDIAEAKVPVIVSALPDLPRAFEALGARLENAGLLAKAGVKVAISPRSREDHFTRTTRLEAGNAVANGMAWEDALAAVTRLPAEIFGVAGVAGTLAAGKSADVVVWSGDPFEPLTRPRHVFIAGRQIPAVSRQTLLRDRYKNLRGARPLP
jgi:imidazolonepropionase-like amidohydrolase